MEILTFNYNLAPKVKLINFSFIIYCLRKRFRLPLELNTIINDYMTTQKDLKEYTVIYEAVMTNDYNYNQLNCVTPALKIKTLHKYILPSITVCPQLSDNNITSVSSGEYILSSKINTFFYYHNDKNANLYILNQPFHCNIHTTTDLLSSLIYKYS